MIAIKGNRSRAYLDLKNDFSAEELQLVVTNTGFDVGDIMVLTQSCSQATSYDKQFPAAEVLRSQN